MSRTTTAFVKLAELASVCRKHARALPSSEKTQSVWTGIGISLHHAYYVCPLNEVAEILKVPPYTKLPGVGGWVNGVANVR
ncbi:MAG: chemotaxis protein CheW, partial [Gammaproteobacteria bacterium]